MAMTSICELREMVKVVAKITTNFQTQLNHLEATLEYLQYAAVDERVETIIALILEAETLVRKCPQFKKWNVFKFRHSRKLKDVNYKLLNICSNLLSPTVPETRLVSGSAPTTAKTPEQPKYGWRVARLPRSILTFDEPLKKLKARVVDDSSVVVVSADAGCGKTTLVNILCHDPQIEAIYGKNMFYVTVPEEPNFMVMVNDLLSPNQQPNIQSNKDAKDKLKKFLCKQAACGPILLVLDGVQSDLFVENFRFKIIGYKILVTSRLIFPKYDAFHLEPLSDEDAKALFKLSAFDESVRITSPTIDDDLVNQMVKCCKNHPLTLSAVGSSLKGKSQFVWKSVMKTFSQGELIVDNNNASKLVERTIEQLDEEFKNCLLDLESLDEEFKQGLLDLGLFPRDQRISACALLDIWTNLYDHDDMGRDTLINIFQLADRNLVSSITIGEEANAIVNYCDQTFATQHDWQRELAIHVSSKEPISQRTRLIIDAQGKDLPAPIRQMKEVIKARILSISTGELFSWRWCDINAPEVEVMVLNIMSKTYMLPHFLQNMHRLKVLNVTNYSLHPTKIVNFHLLGRSTSLTKIRLEHVVLTLSSISILALVNLHKFSLITCKIGNSFEKLSTDNCSAWPRLIEIEIDNCKDLVGFPEFFCNIGSLKKLSITNCSELIEITEEFGKLTSLETLSLRSCTKLVKLPDSISRLKKLSILDISDCLSLSMLPESIGELGDLGMIYMKGCPGIHEIPPSVKDLSQPQVFCNQEMCYKWHEFPNVNIPEVEEDRLFTLTENIFNECFQ